MLAAAAGRWLWDRAPPQYRPRLRAALGAAVLAALLAGCFYNSRRTLTEVTNVLLIETDGERASRSFAGAAQEALRRERTDHCLLCVTDFELWPSAAGLVVQLTKAGIAVSAERTFWMLLGDAHAHPRRDDGKLLLVDARDAARFQKVPGVVAIAESKTTAMALLWHSANSEAAGDYSAADLPFFTLDNEGFSGCERFGDEPFCWSDGPSSRMAVKLAAGCAYRLTLRVAPFYVHGKVQVVSVLLNGTNVGEVRLDNYLPAETTLDLPAAVVKDRNEIVFRYAYTARPMDLGQGADARELGIQLYRLKLERVAR